MPVLRLTKLRTKPSRLVLSRPENAARIEGTVIASRVGVTRAVTPVSRSATLRGMIAGLVTVW